MANSKQKPVDEGVKRSPGKSKFSIPRKEAPPIDGSYLDRLFADYEKQAQQSATPADISSPQAHESPASTSIIEQESSVVTNEVVDLHPDAAPSEILEEPPAQPVAFPEQEKVEDQNDESTLDDQTTHAQPPAIVTAHTPASIRVTPEERAASTIPTTSADDALLLEKWKKKHRMGKGEIKVLRALIGMCREVGADHCYIKISVLMTAADLKERQTQLVLRSLSELGLIEKLAEYSNIDRLGTKYRVVLDAD